MHAAHSSLTCCLLRCLPHANTVHHQYLRCNTSRTGMDADGNPRGQQYQRHCLDRAGLDGEPECFLLVGSFMSKKWLARDPSAAFIPSGGDTAWRCSSCVCSPEAGTLHHARAFGSSCLVAAGSTSSMYYGLLMAISLVDVVPEQSSEQGQCDLERCQRAWAAGDRCAVPEMGEERRAASAVRLCEARGKYRMLSALGP